MEEKFYFQPALLCSVGMSCNKIQTGTNLLKNPGFEDREGGGALPSYWSQDVWSENSLAVSCVRAKRNCLRGYGIGHNHQQCPGRRQTRAERGSKPQKHLQAIRLYQSGKYSRRKRGRQPFCTGCNRKVPQYLQYQREMGVCGSVWQNRPQPAVPGNSCAVRRLQQHQHRQSFFR